ncbi:MAG: thermonuclease family protein [Candidatus Brocadiales bacterium]
MEDIDSKAKLTAGGIGGLLLITILIITSLDATSVEVALCTGVIDGDTIELSTGKRVRYIGVNTPEVHRVDAITRELGKEAKAYNEGLVIGKTVRLLFDVQQKDEYGNFLAYVYVGRTFVNAELVRAGYASAARHPPNVRHAELFKGLEREAKENDRGLWSVTKKARHRLHK